MGKTLVIAALFALSATTCLADTQKISSLPLPTSGSIYLSQGDIVAATRGAKTYGLRFNAGSACGNHQWVTNINAYGGGACAQPAFSDLLGYPAVSQLGTGTPSSSTFLRGDGTWASVAAESAITALTGDVTASGAGSVVATLATVNSNVGTWGDASHAPVLTVDGKGRITAASQSAISIASGAVSGLAASATTDTTNAANITSGTLPAARIPAPTTTTRGGILSLASAVSHKFLTYIDGTGTQNSAQPAASDLSNGTTGSGAVVLATSPTLTTPNIGNATAGTVTATTGAFTNLSSTNTITGSISGNAATVTTNANLTGDVTSVGNASSISATTVTGKALTGFSSATGSVTASDTILSALSKLYGNAAAYVVNLASGVTGTLGISNGGTGATTRQAALNALAGAQTSGYFLRGDGVNVGMAAITASDVPTLNQSTTGNAATATVLQTARTLNGVSFDGSANVTIPPLLTGDVTSSGNVTTYNGTVPVAKGGTGATTAAGARTNLGLASVAASGSASDLTTGTLGTTRLPSPFASGTASGNTSKFATVSGVLTAGNCLQTDASGNVVDAGAACGSGGGGSGTVNSGTINQLGYYAATGTAISGLATANNGVLVTSGAGVPSISTTLPSGLTIPGYLTGNQTVTLSGDVSGSGATAITATIGANAVTFAKLQQLGANTVAGNGTGSTANATALAVPSCSGATNALTWTSGTGFGCNTIASGGSGTVNSSTQYQLGYYSATGTAVSGSSTITTDASNNLLVTTGSIAVGTATPRAALDLGAKTAGVLLPVGTTGARNASPSSGTIWYNSTLQRIEAYINGKWTQYQIGERSVDVTLPPYNAVCDGSTNDTTAFSDALASGYAVYVPPTANGCAVNNLTVPSDSRFVGRNAKVWYDETTGTRSWITNTAGATRIFYPTGNSGFWLQNMDVAGRNLTWGTPVQCIAGGGASVYLITSSLRFCGNGGLGSSSDAYTNAFFSWFSNFYANGQSNYSGGINNIIDSQVIGGAITSSLYGIYLPSGADSNAFVGVRVEWNASYGVFCDTCHNNVMTAMTVDANEDGGIYLHNAGTFQFDGYLWRNGVTATSGKQSHIIDAGGNTDININAVYKHGFDDGGGGTDRPKYVLETTGTGSVGFNLSNQPMRGGYVTAPYLFTANPTSMNLDGNDTGKAVTITSCGTSPSVAGDDNAGAITVGSGTVTACTMTFGNASYRNRRCTFSAGSNVTVYPSSVSSSAITVTTSASIGSGKIYYNCSP